MTITECEYAATTVRALMAAETAMASINCGAAKVTRARAEELLDDYFTRAMLAKRLLDLAARLIAQDEAPASIERGGRKAHPV
jgi:hypothetical protein